MTILRDMQALDKAINEESWDWLSDNWPLMAGAVSEEVDRGAKAKDIGRHVLVRTQRPAVAMRCKQAAEYLLSQNGHS